MAAFTAGFSRSATAMADFLQQATEATRTPFPPCSKPRNPRAKVVPLGQGAVLDRLFPRTPPGGENRARVARQATCGSKSATAAAPFHAPHHPIERPRYRAPPTSSAGVQSLNGASVALSSTRSSKPRAGVGMQVPPEQARFYEPFSVGPVPATGPAPAL